MLTGWIETGADVKQRGQCVRGDGFQLYFCAMPLLPYAYSILAPLMMQISFIGMWLSNSQTQRSILDSGYLETFNII